MGQVATVLPHIKCRSGAQMRRHARKLQRQTLLRDAWVILIQPNLPWQKINTIDVSPVGVGFITDKLLKTGEHFALRLRIDDENGGLYLCRVKFCRATEDGHYQAGAAFEASVPNPASPLPTQWLDGINIQEPEGV